MDALRKSRLMYFIISKQFTDWEKSYWELDWVTTDDFREYAQLFGVKPKAGATGARTLYERLQKYHFNYENKIKESWEPTDEEINKSVKEMYIGAFGE